MLLAETLKHAPVRRIPAPHPLLRAVASRPRCSLTVWCGLQRTCSRLTHIVRVLSPRPVETCVNKQHQVCYLWARLEDCTGTVNIFMMHDAIYMFVSATITIVYCFLTHTSENRKGIVQRQVESIRLIPDQNQLGCLHSDPSRFRSYALGSSRPSASLE
jgi:hypothetical protein